MTANPCKTCKKYPIFPFEPSFKIDKNGEVYMEYKLESQCDCPVTLGYKIRIYKEARPPNEQEMEPLFKAWNEYNNALPEPTP